MAAAARACGSGGRALGGFGFNGFRRRRTAAAALLLLPLLLLPAQLLAPEQSAMAGAEGPPIRSAARLHGLPAVQGAGLALRTVDPDEVLPRKPLLARPVLVARRTGFQPVLLVLRSWPLQ